MKIINICREKVIKFLWKDTLYLNVFIIIIIVYVLFQGAINKEVFHPTNTAYYNYLLDSFSHGRFDIDPPNKYDLSRFNDKWYMYWGPSPALFIAPFYFIYKLEASDKIYGLIAGIANCAIFMLLVNEFSNYFNLKIKKYMKLVCIISFAFASPNFYLSLYGQIWSVYQVISIFYILLFYLFYFKFLNNIKKPFLLIIALIFFTLAWTARFTLIFNGLLLIYPFILLYRERWPNQLKRLFIVVICILFISFVGMLLYNYVRFQNPLELGYKYQIGSERYNNLLHEGKAFSFSYIPHNITYYFLNYASLRLEKPFIIIDHEGNSVFSVYPLLLILFSLVKKYNLKNVNILIVLLCIIVGLTIALLMLYLATGWIQFGSRYFFDVIPILFLISLFAMKKIFPITLLILVLYGIFVNFLGALLF